MTNETGLISGEDVLLIIEALDEYAKRGRDPAPHERKDYGDFERLRARLKLNLDMEWSASARWWLRACCARSARVCVGNCYSGFCHVCRPTNRSRAGSFGESLPRH